MWFNSSDSVLAWRCPGLSAASCAGASSVPRHIKGLRSAGVLITAALIAGCVPSSSPRVSTAGLETADRKAPQADPGREGLAPSAPSQTADLWRSSVFRNKDGTPFHFAATLGKPVILNFFFSHCGSYCPAQATSLAELQRDLHRRIGADGYWMVSVSLTPERDKLDDIRAFVGRFSADEANWHFVTGTPEATESLIQETKAEVISYPDSAFPDVDHTTDVYVLDALGKLTDSFVGLPLDERGLAEAVVRNAAAASTRP